MHNKVNITGVTNVHRILPLDGVANDQMLILIRILGLLSTMCKPVELSQPPSLFLGFHLITGLFLLPDYRNPIFTVLRTTARGSGAGRHGRCLHSRTHGGVRSAAFLATKCVLYQWFLAFMGDSTSFNVPNLWAYKVSSRSERQASDRPVGHT